MRGVLDLPFKIPSKGKYWLTPRATARRQHFLGDRYDTTELNGATEMVPGSHLWDSETIAGAVKPADFSNRAAERETGDRADAIKMTMPSGSLAITKGKPLAPGTVAGPTARTIRG